MSQRKIEFEETLSENKAEKNHNVRQTVKSSVDKRNSILKPSFSVPSPLQGGRFGYRSGNTFNRSTTHGAGAQIKPKPITIKGKLPLIKAITEKNQKPGDQKKIVGDDKRGKLFNSKNSFSKQPQNRTNTHASNNRFGYCQAPAGSSVLKRSITQTLISRKQNENKEVELCEEQQIASSNTVNENHVENCVPLKADQCSDVSICHSAPNFITFDEPADVQHEVKTLAESAYTVENEKKRTKQVADSQDTHLCLVPITKRLGYHLPGQKMTRSISYGAERGLNLATQQTTSLTQQFSIEFDRSMVANVLVPSRSTDCLSLTNTSAHDALVPFGNTPIVNYEDDPVQAGMRLFTIIILKSWRDRRIVRDELLKQLDAKRHSCIRTKNQLHMVQTLVNSEVKHIKDLKKKLENYSSLLKEKEHSRKELETTEATLRAEKVTLAEQLVDKELEINKIQSATKETQAKICNVLKSVKDLEEKLEYKQEKVDKLESKKNDWINLAEKSRIKTRAAIEKLCYESAVRKAKLSEEKDFISAQIARSQIELQEMALLLNSKELRLLLDIENVCYEANQLREQLSQTIEARIWSLLSSSKLHKIVLESFHWAAYIIIPVVPPPKAKFLEEPVKKLIRFLRKQSKICNLK